MGERELVEKFIRSSGFPLEFATGRALRAAGFVPQHGRHYAATLPDGQVKNREIDVLAPLFDSRLAAPTSLVVECKHATAPWVVMSGDEDARPLLIPIGSFTKSRDEEDVALATRSALAIRAPLSYAIHRTKDGIPKPDDAVPPSTQSGRRSAGRTTSQPRLSTTRSSTRWW
jgi:hypothetical protein